MSLPKVSLSEPELLRKEIESLGESLDRERLELRSQIERLKVEFEALKLAMTRTLPEFATDFDRAWSEKLQSYNPETERNSEKASLSADQPPSKSVA